MNIWCSLCVLVVLVLTGPAAALPLVGKARVTDGDSLVIGQERIRLHGIDAPELKQRCDPVGRNWACGAWSAQVLAKIVSQGVLACDAVDVDRYGRTVARCRVNGRDVGASMVQAGAATAYARYSRDYIGLEAAAKADARGIWSGQMVQPSTYRKMARPVPVPQGCQIKGNINAKGKRIYHMPGQRDWARTRISTAKGEAFFCTENEARSAGFRAARR